MNDRSVTLVGFALDPDRPAADDRQIVGELMASLQGPEGWESFLRRTDGLSGRWIVIVDAGSWVRLFADPCGYRQVVYTRQGPSEVWCASQSGLLAQILELSPSAPGRRFIREFAAQGSDGWPPGQHWWPGDTTAYDEVHRLLPNHSLELTSGEVRRFWPTAPLAPLSSREAVEQNAGRLRGVMQSAARRSPLALTLTAGRDTRLLVAAARGVADGVMAFTLTASRETETDVDVAVARRVAARLGLPHSVIACPAVMTPWFASLYLGNVDSAHEVYGVLAEGMFKQYPPDRLCLKGNAMHIVHGYVPFRRAHLPPGRRVDPDVLLRLGKIPRHEFARQAVARWLDDAGPASPVDLLNLFVWENKEGSWQAASQLEWDIVQEVLVPFNCRSFLADGLAVDLAHRTWPEHTYQRDLTAALWPEALREPINPPWPASWTRLQVREWLIRTGLIRYVRLVRKAAGARVH